MYYKTGHCEDFESLRATTNSYFGMLRHADAYTERKRFAKQLGAKGAWFDRKLTKLKGIELCIS